MSVYILRGPSKAQLRKYAERNLPYPQHIVTSPENFWTLRSNKGTIVALIEGAELWRCYGYITLAKMMGMRIELLTLLCDPNKLMSEREIQFATAQTILSHYLAEAIPEEWKVETNWITEGEQNYAEAVRLMVKQQRKGFQDA